MRFEIDDPVVLDPELVISSRLDPTVHMARGRRKDLDDQERRLLDAALRNGTWIRDHEQVGLEDVVRVRMTSSGAWNTSRIARSWK